MYLVQSQANPYNKTNPVAVSLYTQLIYLASNFQYEYDAFLDLSNVITEDSIIPLQSSINQSNFYSFNDNIKSSLTPTYFGGSTFVNIYPSATIYTYNRSY